MKTRKSQYVQNLFNSIANDYDKMNLLLTGRMLIRWQRKLIEELKLNGSESVIDVCCGSGELTTKIYKKLDRNGKILGIDFSENMIKVARAKAEKNNMKIEFFKQDALNLEFGPESFDIAVNCFALRNVEDIKQAISEMYRVTKPGGQVLVMEVSRPLNPFFKFFFDIYFFKLVPIIGKIADRGRQINDGFPAYTWLSESLKKFPNQEVISGYFRELGFDSIEYKLFGFGGITIFIGKKK